MAYTDELTLVIPTYERQELVLTAMRYWLDKGIELHVIDGSAEPIAPSKLPASEKIHYHHMPEPLFDRLGYAIELVQTPYCCLISDDEFFLPSGLKACVEELSNDPNLVACLGRTLSFDATSDQIMAAPGYVMMAGRSISDATPAERMRAHLGNYMPSTVYAVARSHVWKTAIRTAIAKSFPVYALGELRFEAAVAFQGPNKVIPVLSWLRNVGQPPTRGQDETLDTKNRFHGWWHDEAKKDQRREFLSLMAENLQPDATPEQKAQLEQEVEQAFADYDDIIQQRKRAPKAQNLAERERRRSKKRSRKRFSIKRMLRALISGSSSTSRRTPKPGEPREGSSQQSAQQLKQPKRSDRKDIFLAAKDLSDEGVFVDFGEIREIVKLLGFEADRKL